MRETRQSGSEGGGACGAPYPYPDFAIPARFSPVRNRSDVVVPRSPDCPADPTTPTRRCHGPVIEKRPAPARVARAAIRPTPSPRA